MGFVASKKGKKDGVHDDAKQAFGLLFFRFYWREERDILSEKL